MLTTSIAAALLLAPVSSEPQGNTGMLIVDRLLIGTLTAQGWKNGESDVSKSVKPFRAYPVDLVRARSWQEFLGFEWSDGVTGNFLTDDYRGNDVFWSGARPRYPRAISTMNPDSSVYRGYVESQLRADSKGKRSYKAEVTTLARVDLDGDGTEEVLIEAQNVNGSDNDMLEPPVGAFSGVFVRHIVGGKAKTEPLFVSTKENEEEGGLLERFQFRAIADLDGDGKYEVVVSTAYYEGSGAVVFGYRSGKMIEKVAFGAGA